MNAPKIAEKLARLTPEQQEALLRRLRPGILESARQVRADGTHKQARPYRFGVDPNYELQIRTAGVLDSLACKVVPLRDLAPGEIRIEVHAASMNFRDVMIALGMYPLFEGDARPAFGFDCSGVVSAVGEGASRFAVGDEVMGFAKHGVGCFSQYASAAETSFMPKPVYLSHQEAAATLGVLVTAYYSLVEVGRLSCDERVLIHSAAGGVGLAAVQVAQWIGAEVFATTSNPEKTAYLRSLGVQHIMDSRSDAFIADTQALTQGEGVDLILNSLPGDLIERQFPLLRQYGRFLELGRRDVIENRPLGMALFDQAVVFATVNISFSGEMRKRMDAGVMRLLDERLFVPLPMKVFPIDRAADAFAHMSSGRHIGKIVLQIKGVPVEVVA